MAGRRIPSLIQGQASGAGNGSLVVACPMCRYAVRQPNRAIDSGDRILVLKYIYEFTEPRRWDVVVFKNPKNPQENYIKRLVGKAGEWLWVLRGNVYTRPTDSDPWRIERKPADVQRAVWQPIYHSDYAPRDGGDGSQRDLDHMWSVPWQRDDQAHWQYEHDMRCYRFDGSTAQARLDFDFANQHGSADYYPYNSFDGRSTQRRWQYIVDELRIAATFTPQQEGLTATLNLTTADRRFTAVVRPDGSAELRAGLINADAPGEQTLTAPAGTVTWQVDRGVRLDLWHVDQSVSLWADGKLVCQATYNDELSDDAMRAMRDSSIEQVPQVSIEVAGAAVTLSQVDMDRDLYYTPQDDRLPIATVEPVYLAADRFFCMGDNSPQSEDSRLWQTVDPWISYHCSDGDDPLPRGMVPRKLLIGKAFFVYWPSAYRLKSDSTFIGVVPNFGQMRVIK